MSEIRINQVYKSFDHQATWAVRNVSLTIPAHSFVVFLGPSGCGKTTLLKMVNRLVEPTRGEILVDGVDVRSMDPTDLRRGMGYSIQRTGLFPHMTVAKNIAVVPSLLGWPQPQIDARVSELLSLMNMDPQTFLDRRPAQLSGGQQQRVGIARALAADPSILLMDEPFGAIDAITRTDLQAEIAQLHKKLDKTILFVTHDVDEALRLADYIAVMRQGELVQFARPVDLLNAPADAFVAKLLNTGDKIRQISLVKLEEIMQPLPQPIPANAPAIHCAETVREALSRLLTPEVDGLLVLDEKTSFGEQPVGWITLEDIRQAGGAA